MQTELTRVLGRCAGGSTVARTSTLLKLIPRRAKRRQPWRSGAIRVERARHHPAPAWLEPSPSPPQPTKDGLRGEPVKVLHVFGVMNRGGAETRTLEVMRQLDPSRVRLMFCALSGEAGAFDDEIRQLGGEVFYCRLDFRFPLRFVRLLKQLGIDVVHSHVATTSAIPLWLARRAGVAVRVAHFRSDSDGHPDTPYHLLRRRLLRKIIDASSTHILAVTAHAMESAWAPNWQEDGRCRIVFNGVDLAPFRTVRQTNEPIRPEGSLAEGQRLCINIGKAGKAKNRLRAVMVHAQVCRLLNNPILLFVGPPNEEEDKALLFLATRMGTNGLVRFAGSRDDVAELVREADLVLQPSVREGLPGAVLEACAAGTPVLTSDLPGAMEIAQHFPEVHCLPLSAPDTEWAQAAYALITAGKSRDGPAHALRRFDESPFTLAVSAATLTAIWENRT